LFTLSNQVYHKCHKYITRYLGIIFVIDYYCALQVPLQLPLRAVWVLGFEMS
jgi:hypothetical protein